MWSEFSTCPRTPAHIYICCLTDDLSRSRRQIPDFVHVTNQKDPVPTVPPHALSFEQPQGEIHITAVDDSTGNATMVACPGQENQVCTSCKLRA